MKFKTTSGFALDASIRSKYQFCDDCRQLHCVCESPKPRPAAPVEDGPDIGTLVKPKGGKSMPFWIHDGFAREQGLNRSEQLTFQKCIRETFGREKFHGNYISIPMIAEDMNISRASVCRALNRLEAKGLIIRKRQFEGATRPWKMSWIGVIIPGHWEPSQPENEHDSGGEGVS